MLDGKAKISVFEGTSFFIPNSNGTIQPKKLSVVEKTELKKISDVHENISKAIVQIFTGLVVFALGGILCATQDEKKRYDNFPNSARSQWDGSHASCVSTVDSHNSSIALQVVLNLIGNDGRCRNGLVRYKNFAEAEKRKNSGTSVTFKMKL